MKLFQVFSLIFATSLGSCSTAILGVSPRPIKLAHLEALRPGKATSVELRESLGEPGRTIAVSALEEAWVYSEPRGPANWQRASFTIDKRSGSILASVLILNEEDPQHELGQAIRYFSKSRFVIKDEGWINGHHHSDNANYSDRVNGVSMTVRKVRNTVSEISFWLPSDEQGTLAAGKKSL